ncbi:velvet factor-domain-containing protein [Calycina marina]|uniref:Velvet factor-domain-containing protein n=1 Tax=Calycina marina TaxID=1763456 RepID=A0A9P8CI43_9HELO|nr:velvet factor-domain-containing protein [Calycina marina]
MRQTSFSLLHWRMLVRLLTRGQTQNNNAVPVLTGMPVSGMAYLDRPKEAGYFIFPDLSVRHEGQYKLSFNLYEQTVQDVDHSVEPQSDIPDVPGEAADSSFDWRLEVKSVPFIVWSAKKFPGLAESTALSRVVAEQGCRVRIRRDVRMRRHGGKMGNEGFDREVCAYERTGMSQQPSHDGIRSYSNSPTPTGRHNSGDFPQAPPGGNLNFGQRDGYGPPASFAQPSLPVPSAPRYAPQYSSHPPPPPLQHQSIDHRPPPPPPLHIAPRLGHYPHERESYPHTAHPSTHSYELEAPGADYRRASDVGYAASHSRPLPYEPTGRTPFSRVLPSSPDMKNINLPPLNNPDFKYECRPSIPGPMSVKTLVPSPPLAIERKEVVFPTSAYQRTSPDTLRPAKRSFDTAYPDIASRENSSSLHNRKRPEALHITECMEEDEDNGLMEPYDMSYKRADGNTDTRTCPEIQ